MRSLIPLFQSKIPCVCLSLLAAVSLSGCGDGIIKRYPVVGHVTVDGNPAEGALVIFCPFNSGPELANFRPAGVADASGAFKLTTVEPGDGAPAGNYKVLVKWCPTLPNQEDAERGGRGGAKGPDRLKGKYYNLDTTPLNVTIEKKSNELAPLDLKTK